MFRFLFGMFFLVFSITCLSESKQVIEIYYLNNYPPYAFLNEKTGKPDGYYTKIVQLVFSNLRNYNLKLTPIPWKRGLNLIEKGEAFALYPPYHRYKERPYIYPYSLPLGEEITVIVCNKKRIKGFNLEYPRDFAGIHLVLDLGYELGRDNAFVKEGKISITDISSVDQAIKMLFHERADCYINDRLAIIHALKKNKKINRKTIKEKGIIKREFGFIGYSEKFSSSYKENFIRSFNSEFNNLYQKGIPQKILLEYTSMTNPLH